MKSFMLGVGAFCCAMFVSGAAPARDWSFIPLGFSISTPEGWSEVSSEQHFENLSKFDFGALKKRMAQATVPIVGVTQFPEPHPELNPSLKVTVRAAPTGDPDVVQYLSLISKGLRSLFKDVVIVDAPQPVQLGGVEGAYLRMRYTLVVEDLGDFPAESRMWVAIHNGSLFIVGVGTSQTPDPEVVAALDAAVASISFSN